MTLPDRKRKEVRNNAGSDNNIEPKIKESLIKITTKNYQTTKRRITKNFFKSDIGSEVNRHRSQSIGKEKNWCG